jgi:neurexin
MIAKHWLSLNEVTHHLSGMPLEQHIGYHEYTLEGTDEDGRVARCNDVTVEVRARPLASRKEAVFEATAKFNISYDYFCNDADLRIDVANKLGRAFGDDDSSHLAITSITRGSVVMGWTNTSIVGGGDGSCPAEQIGEIQTKMFTNEGTLRKSFQDAMDPYEILGASLTPRGHCTLAVVTISPTTSVSSEDLRVGAKTASTSNSVTAIIIPVLIIILLVVIASIIACVLIRRRKRMAKKAASPDKSVKHGAPVIFAYELDDATSTTPSKPLIGGANSERPPAPPNYQLATAPTPPSTDHRRALLSTDPAADQMSPLKYQPPPGSMVRGGPGSSSAQSAARHPPTYQST